MLSTEKKKAGRPKIANTEQEKEIKKCDYNITYYKKKREQLINSQNKNIDNNINDGK